ELRFRHGWLLLLGLGLQIAITVVFAGSRSVLHNGVHVGSYVAVVAFLLLNRRIPGLWLVALGTLMNVTAIVSNGGVMPASAEALAAAGLPTTTSGFVNSAALGSPHLSFLGDIFAVPSSWPLSNVFSAGDICISVGILVIIHRASGSRLVPSGRGQFAPVLRRPTFMRLWSAQAISNLGDWLYVIAVAATLVSQTRSPKALALLLVAQTAPAAVFGGLLGGLHDRYSRVRIMISADLVRAAAVGSLLFVHHPSLLHIYGVAALLGVFGALFQPSLEASIPNAVAPGEIVAANALVGGTMNFAIMAGPALGGFLVASFGARPVFGLNAGSFVLSAVLLAGLRLKQDTAPGEERATFRDLAEGAKYSIRTPLVRGLLLVIGLVFVAAATKAPLESLFVLGTLSLGPTALGLVTGSWGLGMVLGSVAAPALARRWRREGVLVVMIGVVGLAAMAAAGATGLQTVLLVWLGAGVANAVGNVCYDSLLQERVPDRFRGRVFAAFELVANVGFLAGALLAAWLGSALGVRPTYAFSGALLLVAAFAGRRVLFERRVRHAAPPLLPSSLPAVADEPVQSERVALSDRWAFRS
ncbi:MAG TPA: MFS transporter, partial [Actinomycetota bacterium]